jgi:hypothetical protein
MSPEGMTISSTFSPTVLQLLLSPVLLWRSFLANGLSVALYAASLGYYHYMTFLGYSALPFLEHTEVRWWAILIFLPGR